VIIPVRCFTCGKVISQVYEDFRKRYNEYQKVVKSGEIPTENPKDILDDLGVDRLCCRRMIISHVDLIQESTPYE
jgi:DNA-directed RNA polymerase subunit N